MYSNVPRIVPSWVSACCVGSSVALDCIPAGAIGLGESEVEQLYAGFSQHHVARLQVPVHDPLPVRLVQSVGDLDPVAQRLVERKWALREAGREGLALEEFHDEVLDVAFPTHVVERADVWMRQLRDRLRLALEAKANVRGRSEVGSEDLDRDRPLEPRVPRLVHLSHPARPERRHDLVRAETRAGGERHRTPSTTKSSARTRRNEYA